MTLVVARLGDCGAITISSDTAVTDYVSEGTGRFDALKSLILSPTLCVSFAGFDPDRATEWVLRSRTAAPSFDPVEVAQVLSQDTGNRDYVVASIQGGASLTRVKDGRVETGLPATWIGDWRAFSEYQARLDIARVDPAKQALGQLQQLTDVVEDEHLPGVDGAVVRVVVAADGFRYAGDGTIYFDFDTHGTVSPGEIEIKTPPPNYSLIQCVPRHSGVPAVGLYFPQGECGYLLAPEVGGRHTLRDVGEAAQFVEQIRSQFDVDLSCPEYPF